MSIKMKELPEAERPYEKLELYGEKVLTNAELIAIIIKNGTKEETSIGLAQRILNLNNDKEKDNLNFLREITIEELMKIKGIGKVKAIQLKAVCELAVRMNAITNYKDIIINKPKDIAEVLIEKTRFEKQEILKIAMLDNKNKLMKIKDVATGGGNFVSSTIKSVLSEPVKMQAAKIILIHNHPSGDSTPSDADIMFTDKVESASKILGIQLLDHIVLGNNNFTSIFAIKMRNRKEEKT